MTDIGELYQQLILDHNASPRNFGKPSQTTHHADGHNPLCGDDVHLYLHISDDIIREVGFEGTGCAISKAASSMMTAAIAGKSVAEARELFSAFHRMLTAESPTPGDDEKLGKLSALGGVRRFPMRVKCATLPWHTMEAALTEQARAVSTE